jgi:hypothetical protein
MYTCAMAIPAHTPAQCWFCFILRAIPFARFISFRRGPLARMPWSPHRHALRAFIFNGFASVSRFFSSLSPILLLFSPLLPSRLNDSSSTNGGVCLRLI